MHRSGSDQAAGPAGVGRSSPTAIAPLWVEVAGARRVLVRPASLDDRLADLMDALVGDGFLPPGPVGGQTQVQVDDRGWPPGTTLLAAGVRMGSHIGWVGRPSATGNEPRPTVAAPLVELRVVAGPDAGHCWSLGPGRYVIGRAASATLQVADPSVEPHHLCVDVAEGGVVTAVQLCGHVPVRCGSDPLPRAPLSPGAVLHLSDTSLAIAAPSDSAPSGVSTAIADPQDPAARPTQSPGDPWRVPRRRVACPPPATPTTVTIPDPDREAARASRSAVSPPVAPALVSLGLSVVMAAVLGRPEIVWFGGLAASMGLVVWAHHRLRDVRARRRARHREVECWSSVRAQLHVAHESAVLARWRSQPELPEMVRRAARGDDRVWRRRGPAGDGEHSWTVVLGRGDVPWDAPAQDSQGRPVGALELADRPVGSVPNHLPGVPVPLPLAAGSVVGVTGPQSDGLVRSMLVQLAVEVGPADWQLVVVTPDRRSSAPWRWCRWLPHTSPSSDALLLVAELPDAVPILLANPRHLVLVVTDPRLVAHRTGPVRRLLGALGAAGVKATTIVLDSPGDTASPTRLPTWTTSRIVVGGSGSARWATPDRPDVVFRPAACSEALARRVARALAGWSDPEDDDAGAGLDGAVTLTELVGSPADDRLAARWSLDDAPPATVLGMAADGLVEIDLARDGPHALVAGTTGSGKSELLRTLVCGLALGSSPHHLSFVLIDYKGGSAFDACARLPHVVGVVTDLDDHLGARVLLGLDAELRRREQVLRAAGVSDLGDLRRDASDTRLARLVVVVDEFATLAAEVPDFLGALVSIAQRGRSLGVHLVLATQRPGGVVRDDVRANTNLRIALRMQDPGDALDVVGEAAPASFPRDRPGRAMVRLGPGELVPFQVAMVSLPWPHDGARRLQVALADELALPGSVTAAEEPTELEHLVALACRVAEREGYGRLDAPWLPPLPEVLATVEDPSWVGVLDDPQHQRQHSLTWTATGHLVVVGGRRSGVSSTLVVAARVLAAQRSPADLHLYGVDARGGTVTRSLADLDHCGDVIGVNDTERLLRLLERGTAELDRRLVGATSPAEPAPIWVLVVDGWGALRSSLEHDLTRLAQLDRLSAEGPAHGLVMAVGAERPGVVTAALAAVTEHRWAHLQSDPLDAAAAGCSALLPGSPPGRLVDATTGLIGQVLGPMSLPLPAGSPDGGTPEAGTRAMPVGRLPSRVERIATPPSRPGAGAAHLPIGVGYRHLDERSLVLAPGDHVMVLGPPGSGRTATLRLLVLTWQRLFPHGHVVVLEGRSTDPTAALDLSAAPGPSALVVDDGDLVDDHAGRLQLLLAERRPDRVAFVAARPDALRGSYGHWTTAVRRGGTGIVLGPAGDLDGDLLGVTLPRVWPLPPRPGLGWLVQRGTAELVQLALVPGSALTPLSTPSMMCTVRSQ